MKRPALLFVLLGMFLAPTAGAEPVKIRTATLAPEGSTWMVQFQEMAQEVRDKTEGRVEFVFYSGGVAGDESLVVRKMRIGQIHAAMLSGVGLSEILPETRILDIPFLCRNHEESDGIRALLRPRFEAHLEERGYVALGWSDLGTLYIFSKDAIRTVEDLRHRRVWVWQGDIVAEATFRTCGVGPIPVAVPDVRSSLQTGLLDTVYVSPLAAIALQWFTSVETMTDLPLLDAFCVIVMSQRQWDRLAPEDRKIVRSITQVHAGKLTERIRRENQDAIRVLEERGIRVIQPDASAREDLGRIAREVSRSLVDRLYPQDLLDEVLKNLPVREGKE